jgi:hypothetical protein
MLDQRITFTCSLPSLPLALACFALLPVFLILSEIRRWASDWEAVLS